MDLSGTPSSSSSSSFPVSENLVEAGWKYDVFLSFCGKDTRIGFTGFLYEALVGRGLNAYRDDEKLRIGKLIRPELLQAIEESKSAVVILSENYAGSTWCLDELAKIVECVGTRDLILLPVFYRVDPSDVRWRMNEFDLTKYETNPGIAKDRVDSWTTALHRVGNSAGLHVKGDRYETDVRDEIVRKIIQQLEFTLPISIKEEMRNLESLIRLLICREDDVKRELGALEMQQPVKKRKREVVSYWLESVEMAKTEFESLRQEVGDIRVYAFSTGQLGKRVKSLTKQVVSLNEESKFPDGLTVDVHGVVRGVPFLTKHVVLGETFRINCEEVLEYLKNDKVSSIGIYGMGGVGKTTVMKHVYNQILADPATFGDVCWVTVSQNFSIGRLQNNIFRKLNHYLPSEDSEESRAAILSDILEKVESKFILILDDVWVHLPLEKVGIPVGGESLCKVIVTTRSLDVCNKMVCQQKIKISPLSPEEAWGLFMEKLGPHEDFTSKVIETAKDVAKRCGGLPLAIITMASSMRGVSDIHEWRDALDELKKPGTFKIDGMKSEVLKAVEYSYNHLGDEESQLCFLSCALYPEDHEIPRAELIKYCIAKGLIRKRDSRQAEMDRGHTTLNKLEKCCLLEPVSDELRVVFRAHVKMHDLIREMALQIMSRKQQVMVKAGFGLTEIPEEEEWAEDLEAVSLIDNDIREIPDGWSPRCPLLSTLMLQRNDSLTRMPGSFFVQLCSLRVLNLKGNQGLRVLPDSVGDLINLIVLWLGWCVDLKHIPSLRKLKKLRDLDLSHTMIEEVPGGVGELRSLRCLNMDNAKYQCDMEELMELKQLEVFRGWVRDVSNYDVLVRSKWFQRLWDDYRLFVSGLGESSNRSDRLAYRGVENEVFLEKLRLGGRGVMDVPLDIKRLVINRCHDTGKCLLEFDSRGEDARTRELKEIEIRGCKEVEWVVTMPSASRDVRLPSIEELSVKEMENMKGIFNWWDYCDSTPSTTIPSFGGGGDYNQSSFSKLKRLYIYRCDEMKVGLTINCLVHLPMLEMLNIAFCLGMEEIIGGGASEDRENSHGVGIGTDIILPKLKVLSLQFLSSLRSVYNKGNIICDSIEEICLNCCKELKSLPLTTTNGSTITGSCSGGSPQPPFSSLRKIHLQEYEMEWWESLELVHPTYHPLLRSFLTSPTI